MAYRKEGEALDLNVRDGIAALLLKRAAEKNTLIEAFWNEFEEAFDYINDHRDVRVVIISALGDAFCIGMDFSFFSKVPQEGEGGRVRRQQFDLLSRMQGAFNRIEECHAPVIAAIQGACVGGGLDMVTACDIRLSTRDAFFCIAEINIGIAADIGTLQRLPKLLPNGLVRDLAFTGRKLSFEEAERAGFITRGYGTHAELLEAAQAMAAVIASKAPPAVSGTKEALNFTAEHDLKTSLRYAAVWGAAMNSHTDIYASIDAFQHRKSPEFDDLYANSTFGVERD